MGTPNTGSLGTDETGRQGLVAKPKNGEKSPSSNDSGTSDTEGFVDNSDESSLKPTPQDESTAVSDAKTKTRTAVAETTESESDAFAREHPNITVLTRLLQRNAKSIVDGYGQQDEIDCSFALDAATDSSPTIPTDSLYITDHKGEPHHVISFCNSGKPNTPLQTIEDRTEQLRATRNRITEEYNEYLKAPNNNKPFGLPYKYKSDTKAKQAITEAKSDFSKKYLALRQKGLFAVVQSPRGNMYLQIDPRTNRLFANRRLISKAFVALLDEDIIHSLQYIEGIRVKLGSSEQPRYNFTTQLGIARAEFDLKYLQHISKETEKVIESEDFENLDALEKAIAERSTIRILKVKPANQPNNLQKTTNENESVPPTTFPRLITALNNDSGDHSTTEENLKNTLQAIATIELEYTTGTITVDPKEESNRQFLENRLAIEEEAPAEQRCKLKINYEELENLSTFPTLERLFDGQLAQNESWRNVQAITVQVDDQQHQFNLNTADKLDTAETFLEANQDAVLLDYTINEETTLTAHLLKYDDSVTTAAATKEEAPTDLSFAATSEGGEVDEDLDASHDVERSQGNANEGSDAFAPVSEANLPAAEARTKSWDDLGNQEETDLPPVRRTLGSAEKPATIETNNRTFEENLELYAQNLKPENRAVFLEAARSGDSADKRCTRGSNPFGIAPDGESTNSPTEDDGLAIAFKNRRSKKDATEDTRDAEDAAEKARFDEIEARPLAEAYTPIDVAEQNPVAVARNFLTDIHELNQEQLARISANVLIRHLHTIVQNEDLLAMISSLQEKSLSNLAFCLNKIGHPISTDENIALPTRIQDAIRALQAPDKDSEEIASYASSLNTPDPSGVGSKNAKISEGEIAFDRWNNSENTDETAMAPEAEAEPIYQLSQKDKRRNDRRARLSNQQKEKKDRKLKLNQKARDIDARRRLDERFENGKSVKKSDFTKFAPNNYRRKANLRKLNAREEQCGEIEIKQELSPYTTSTGDVTIIDDEQDHQSPGNISMTGTDRVVASKAPRQTATDLPELVTPKSAIDTLDLSSAPRTRQLLDGIHTTLGIERHNIRAITFRQQSGKLKDFSLSTQLSELEEYLSATLNKDVILWTIFTNNGQINCGSYKPSTPSSLPQTTLAKPTSGSSRPPCLDSKITKTTPASIDIRGVPVNASAAATLRSGGMSDTGIFHIVTDDNFGPPPVSSVQLTDDSSAPQSQARTVEEKKLIPLSPGTINLAAPEYTSSPPAPVQVPIKETSTVTSRTTPISPQQGSSVAPRQVNILPPPPSAQPALSSTALRKATSDGDSKGRQVKNIFQSISSPAAQVILPVYNSQQKGTKPSPRPPNVSTTPPSTQTTRQKPLVFQANQDTGTVSPTPLSKNVHLAERKRRLPRWARGIAAGILLYIGATIGISLVSPYDAQVANNDVPAATPITAKTAPEIKVTPEAAPRIVTAPQMAAVEASPTPTPGAQVKFDTKALETAITDIKFLEENNKLVARVYNALKDVDLKPYLIPNAQEVANSKWNGIYIYPDNKKRPAIRDTFIGHNISPDGNYSDGLPKTPTQVNLAQKGVITKLMETYVVSKNTVNDKTGMEVINTALTKAGITPQQQAALYNFLGGEPQEATASLDTADTQDNANTKTASVDLTYDSGSTSDSLRSFDFAQDDTLTHFSPLDSGHSVVDSDNSSDDNLHADNDTTPDQSSPDHLRTTYATITNTGDQNINHVVAKIKNRPNGSNVDLKLKDGTLICCDANTGGYQVYNSEGKRDEMSPYLTRLAKFHGKPEGAARSLRANAANPLIEVALDNTQRTLQNETANIAPTKSENLLAQTAEDPFFQKLDDKIDDLLASLEPGETESLIGSSDAYVRAFVNNEGVSDIDFSGIFDATDRDA